MDQHGLVRARLPEPAVRVPPDDPRRGPLGRQHRNGRRLPPDVPVRTRNVCALEVLAAHTYPNRPTPVAKSPRRTSRGTNTSRSNTANRTPKRRSTPPTAPVSASTRHSPASEPRSGHPLLVLLDLPAQSRGAAAARTQHRAAARLPQFPWRSRRSTRSLPKSSVQRGRTPLPPPRDVRVDLGAGTPTGPGHHGLGHRPPTTSAGGGAAPRYPETSRADAGSQAPRVKREGMTYLTHPP